MELDLHCLQFHFAFIFLILRATFLSHYYFNVYYFLIINVMFVSYNIKISLNYIFLTAFLENKALLMTLKCSAITQNDLSTK
jgi:hypothetical protein